MSAIAGIWNRTGQAISPHILDQWSEILTAYGADHTERWSGEDIGLLQCAQFTAPEATNENRLSSDRPANFIIVADARLDNRSELLSRLGMPEQTDVPDSQIILAAYQKWGADCPEKLLGDFAFVIWDAREQKLFCARDAFGVRPFYYYAARDLFVFGSMLRAVLLVDEVPRQLNEDKVADYLLGMFADKARTFYQDVYRLPPAHWMMVTRDTIRIQRYWQLDPHAEIRLKSDAEYAEAYRDLFVESVRCRIRSAVPVGSMLSGGLDSSSVACVAGRLMQQEGRTLHTFSAIFDAVPKSDEREYIYAVLNEGQYESHFVAGDQVKPISDLSNLIPIEEEPYYSPQMYLNRTLWAAAQQHGVRVLLEGLMGDNVISHGYAWLIELSMKWRWLALYRAFQPLAKKELDSLPTWAFMKRAVWQYGIKANTPRSLLWLWRKLRGRNSGIVWNHPPFLNPGFARRIHLEERMKSEQEQAPVVRSARQQHYVELEDGIIPTAMEMYATEARRFGIEPRFPFLDRRLVTFCLAVPASQKLKDGYTRHIARIGLTEFLPHKIQSRTTKANLGWNFLQGLEEDLPLLNQILSSPTANEFIDPSIINALAQKTLYGGGNHNNGLYIFLSAALVAWLDSGGVGKFFYGKENKHRALQIQRPLSPT